MFLEVLNGDVRLNILTTKGQIKQCCSLIVGVVMCIYILFPLFLALILLLPIYVSARYVLFYLAILGAIATGPPAFLMAVFISYFSIHKEISTTLFGCLIVTTYFVGVHVSSILFIPSFRPLQNAYWLIETIFGVIFIFAFALVGAWLVARKRRFKIPKGAQEKIGK